MFRSVVLAALLSGCAHVSGSEQPGRYVTDVQVAVYTVGILATGFAFGFVMVNSTEREK